MEVIPAIDLKEGRCVRLAQGDFARETVFSDDPVATALQWQQQDGSRLHVVDLDGAASGRPVHLQVVSRITAALDIPVQVGGGIRSEATAEAWLDAGADRIVIGTAAVRNPGLVQSLCAKHGRQRIVVAIDAKDGVVALQGWTESGELEVLELADRVARLGVSRLLYTDIARDGMLSGPDLETTSQLVEQTAMAVLASGGVASLEDVLALADTGAEGVIVGRALYTGALDLREAAAAVS